MQRRTRPLLCLSVLLSLLGCGGVVGCSSRPQSMLEVSEQQKKELDDCRNEMRLVMHPTDYNGMHLVDAACFGAQERESRLVEMRIRHNAYVIQQQQTRQLLWLVAGITIAGVVFAGMQLVAGFRLAIAGKSVFEKTQGGSIDVEAKKLSINSSATGVVVLGLSLCFFYIFTERVYLIKEPAGGNVANSETGTGAGAVAQENEVPTGTVVESQSPVTVPKGKADTKTKGSRSVHSASSAR